MSLDVCLSVCKMQFALEANCLEISRYDIFSLLWGAMEDQSCIYATVKRDGSKCFQGGHPQTILGNKKKTTAKIASCLLIQWATAIHWNQIAFFQCTSAGGMKNTIQRQILVIFSAIIQAHTYCYKHDQIQINICISRDSSQHFCHFFFFQKEEKLLQSKKNPKKLHNACCPKHPCKQTNRMDHLVIMYRTGYSEVPDEHSGIFLLSEHS